MSVNKVFLAKLLINFGPQSSLFDHISNGITITDENSKILYTNPAFTKITGYSKAEVRGKNPGMLHSGRHNKKFYKKMWSSLTKHGYWEGEIWNRRKSGEIYPEFLTISKIKQANLNKTFYIAIFSDISFLKKDIKKKLHLAFYDPLTELPNRALYLDRVDKMINHEKNKTVAILYMDLDKFKLVNDTYGHCTGDKLLKLVGKRLTAIVRPGDTIARMGGDEFTAVLVCDKKVAMAFAKRIIAAIEKPFLIDKHRITVSVSIGLSFYPADARKVETLLILADKAMYKAKKTGTQIVFSGK